MQQPTLSQQGMTFSAGGCGAAGLSLAYGGSDEQEGGSAIRRAHELGVRFFGSAALYGWGENEKILGPAVRECGVEIVIAINDGEGSQRA